MSQGWQVVIGSGLVIAFVLLLSVVLGSILHALDKWRGRWPNLYTPEQGRRSFFIRSSIAITIILIGMTVCANVIDASTIVTP